MQVTYQLGDKQITLQIEPMEGRSRVLLPDGSTHIIAAQRLPGDILQITEDGRIYNVAFANTSRGLEISLGGQVFIFTDPAAEKAKRRQSISSGALVAPMVGVVADVLVKAGETVQAYQPVAVVSAMKVYATVEAPFAGKVKAVHVKKDQRVEHGALLVEIEPASEVAP